MQQLTADQPYAQSSLRIPAKIISYIFHPLFLPTFFFFWLTVRFPMQFEGITPSLMFLRKFNVFWITAFFPAFAVFLLWRLKFSENMLLRTSRERIIPYIITMIFYWWMWYLSRNFADQPQVLQFFYFGIFLSTVFGLILNMFFKISMHAMGIAGIFAAIIFTSIYYQSFLGFDISIVTLLMGLVCTSRLILSEHYIGDIYLGIFVGVFCQVISYWLMM